jgi:hypothetical protein
MVAEMTKLTIRRKITIMHLITVEEMMIITIKRKAIMEDIRETTIQGKMKATTTSKSSRSMRRKLKSQ